MTDEQTRTEICDRLDVALFGDRMSGTRWITPSMRLDYLIQVARDMRHSILYLRKENQILEQSWREAIDKGRQT